jgi:hypothetical protein
LCVYRAAARTVATLVIGIALVEAKKDVVFKISAHILSAL